MIRMTLGALKSLLREGSVPVKVPQTPQQKQAMVELLKWVSARMEGSESDLQKALAGARRGEWDEAMDLLRTYYMMKGIRTRERRKAN